MSRLAVTDADMCSVQCVACISHSCTIVWKSYVAVHTQTDTGMGTMGSEVCIYSFILCTQLICVHRSWFDFRNLPARMRRYWLGAQIDCMQTGIYHAMSDAQLTLHIRINMHFIQLLRREN